MAVLDSDFIINYLRGDAPTVNLMQELLKSGITLQTTLINYFEVYFGVIAFEKSPQKIEEATSFLDSLKILFPTVFTCKKSAEIKLALRKKGKTIETEDLFIAGIVESLQETLYTKNAKHFADIPNLKIKPC